MGSYATTASTYTKTEVDTFISNIPLSSDYTATQLDATFSTYYRKPEVDTLLSNKQDSLSNASGEVEIKRTLDY